MKTFAVLSVLALISATSVSALAQTTSGTSGGSTSGSAPSQEIPLPTAGSPTAASPAANAAATSTSTANAPALSTPYRLNAPTWGNYRLRAGIKTTETSGRAYELADENGRRFKQKHEYYLGFVHANGWGGYGQAVTSGSTSAGNGQSTLAGSDASVTILHPDFYKDASLTVSGQFRRYFAVSKRSKNREQQQWAYYVYTNYKMPASWSVWNQATPRYFDQAFYKKGDTTFYFEDISNLTKSISQTLAVGVGQWTQVEWHDRTKTGISVDASFFARYSPIGNLSIEPRLILPAYVQNAVFDAPRAAALDGVRAELYAQLTL